MRGEPAAGLPAEVDLRLWFEMTGCGGRLYFVEGNPRVLGRVYAYCPVKQIVTRVSKYGVTASSEAVYFVRGFLSGSEPPPPLDEEGDLVEHQAAGDGWRQAIVTWCATGRWTGEPGEPDCRTTGTPSNEGGRGEGRKPGKFVAGASVVCGASVAAGGCVRT